MQIRHRLGQLRHEYCALTDHSPRLTIANALSPEWLRKQLDVIDGLRDKFAPLRILTGIEVDLDDGSLDQEPELLDRLDIVVVSVHRTLSMDSAAMTRRMVRAVSDGHADVLGHCTGRLVARNRGIRPESKFDAEAVFAACRDHGTAVEINSRLERRDPPTRLLNFALEIGCVFSIDTDAHAPGQLATASILTAILAGTGTLFAGFVGEHGALTAHTDIPSVNVVYGALALAVSPTLLIMVPIALGVPAAPNVWRALLARDRRRGEHRSDGEANGQTTSERLGS